MIEMEYKCNIFIRIFKQDGLIGLSLVNLVENAVQIPPWP